MDFSVLVDRLYAAAVTIDFRQPEAFLTARRSTSWRDVEAAVRENYLSHREDLRPSPAEAERALRGALKRWQKMVKSRERLRLVTLLMRTAEELLQHDGREMILRVDVENPGREILCWRYISLALPPSILVAAAAKDGLSVPTRVRLLHDSMAPGTTVAHNHVHHAAMMSFDEVWESLRSDALDNFGRLVARLRDARAACPGFHRGTCLGIKPEHQRREGLKSPIKQIAHARHMTQWADTLRQAFTAAGLLDRHECHAGVLSECQACSQAVKTSMRFLRDGRMRPYHRTPVSYPWKRERLEAVRRRRDANEPAVFRRAPSSRTEFMKLQMAKERDLVRRAFSYLRPREKESHDPLYEALFLQYLRVKATVFRLLVHPPGEPGLRSFLEHFQQIKVYAPEAELLRPRKSEEPGLKIGSTEYRVAPDAWIRILGHRDEEIEECEPGQQPAEAGWLVHFKRKDANKGLPLFGADIRAMDAEANRINRALAADPIRLRELCGVDICGVEQAQPLWVSAETLRRTRRHSRRVAGSRPWLGLKPLRLTLHAGEDFKWLTSGVRAVAEPFHWHLIERGDRIGHGIAITLDPAKWWRRNAGAAIPVARFDRLLDLAFLAEYVDKRSHEQEKWLRRELGSLVAELGFRRGDAADATLVENAKKLWKELGRQTTRRLMAQRSKTENPERHESWIFSYLWNRSTQKAAQEEVRLCVDDEGRPERELLIEARKKLIREVARWQVCIESNPSSNLVVGSLDAIAAQDFLQKRPTGPAEYGEEVLTWTISTDDPITFSTTLADEYAYTWAGLVCRQENAYDPSYARALLDEAAATSMRMRFTSPRPSKRKGRGNLSR